MSAHTPGPWFDWDNSVWLHEPAKLLSRYDDARLMAAAPDLYEALNAVFHAKIIYVGGGPEESIAECGMGGELETVRQIIAAALTKARE